MGTKELCHLEPERVCETKTIPLGVKITGVEKECKEVDVCAYGHHFYGCAKTVKKEICHPGPVKEEITKDVELCKLQPKKVCVEKEFKVPTVKCGEPEAAAPAYDALSSYCLLCQQIS